MAFSVQNDSGSVADANAYIDAAYYKDYHTDRGTASVVNSDFTNAEIQQAIIKATDYLDSRYSYVGSKRQQTQTTQWPRFDAVDRDEYVVTGIPLQVKQACAELTQSELESPGSLFPSVPTDSSGQAVKKISEKLDVLEKSVEYFGGEDPGSAVRPPVFYTADWRLKRSGLLINARQVVRG